MCIIVYKPKDVAFPNKTTLKTCFENNPDGAGFMYVGSDNVVHIRKGFDKFQKFYKALQKAIKKTGVYQPYVMHFRISTQAFGRQDCTHPFPLSRKMEDMRLLSASCSIGIAHNGIISLTSSSYNKTITYSDTMLFITDYLSLIIKNKLDYYKDKDTLKLIERLASSKLAILDKTGHCELIGDFIEDNGIYYSNSTYNPKPKYDFSSYYDKLHDKYSDYYDDYDDCYYDYGYDSGKRRQTTYMEDYEHFENCYNDETQLYEFDSMDECPEALYNDGNYCYMCSRKNCPLNQVFNNDNLYGEKQTKQIETKQNK